MDVIKVLAELRQERQQLEEAIITLERLARNRGKRRGRPPAWMSQPQTGQAAVPSGDETKRRRGRPPGSKNKAAKAKPEGEQNSAKDITKMPAGAVKPNGRDTNAVPA